MFPAQGAPLEGETEYTGDRGAEALLEHERVGQALAQAEARVEAGVERWYEVEACLWVLLLVALLKLLDVPRRLFSQHTDPFARWAALVLTLFWALACLVSAWGDALPRRKSLVAAATSCGAVLTLALPFFWVAVLFRACGFPVLILAGTGFMCVIMYPHIRIVPRLRAAFAWIGCKVGKRGKLCCPWE